jgi:hypothetical protein
MRDYCFDVRTTIDNGARGHIATLGGMNLGNGKWLLKTSMSIEQLRVALMENRPDQLQIIELNDQLKPEALNVEWLDAGGATAPPLDDFTARVNTERWRLRE